jgi:LPXTG-site transpeptidase (sortase) family protein
MYNFFSSSPTLTNVTFSGNSAQDGGGMYNQGSSPTLRNLTFSGNSATNGGGMYNDINSSPTLTNVAFSGNSATNGGGMYNNTDTSPTLTNVTFSSNAANDGGGMYNYYVNDAHLTNVIIWDNHGGSIYNDQATLMISYSDVQGCVVFGNWQASCGTDGGGNIDSDPQFVDADGADNTAGTLDDNLRLQLGSPAIDAGNNAAPGLSGITTDLKGYPRFVDGNADNNAVVDMGAYEAQLISPLYAAPASLGEGNCSSWANACTLADALAFAMSGEQVWVKAGVHYPVATTSDPRRATFTLKNGVQVYGGFAGTPGTEDNFSVRDWQTNKTILSGDIDQNDINTDGNYIAEKTTHIQGNNAYHVVTGGGTNNTAVLDGFVITAGQANGGSFPDNVGGGMFNQSSSPTLSNLIFSGNSAYGGGGMDNDYSNPTLTNVTFSGNSATFGGGMLNTSNSSPMLTNVTFSGNSASGGGGMYNHSSSPTLRNLIFSGNSAAFGGGMFNASNSSPMLTNVAFSGNSAGSGGGMYNDLSNPKLTNVTFSGNSATNGGGMYNFSSSPKLTNVIIWGSTSGGSIANASSSNPTISYSDVQGCVVSGNWQASCGTDGGNNIDANPLFVDAKGADNTAGTLDDNLRLQSGSPAIDAGDNSAPGLSGITTDLDGNPRFVEVLTVPDSGNGTPPIVDMGAYEAQDPTPPTVTTLSLQANYVGAGPASFTVQFNMPVADPPGHTGQDDVTNPANYLLIEKGSNGVTDTLSCAAGLSGDDLQQTVTAVSYNSTTFTSTVTLAGALPIGNYHLFICGTTSIVSSANVPLNNGSDFTFDFVVTGATSPSTLPSTGFPMGHVTNLPPQPAEKAYAAYSDLTLEIPSLGIKAPIVGVPKSNGTWDVSWLGNSVGWLEGSAFPTWAGNTVLTGHVWNADNTPGIFAAIKNLKYGDRFAIHAFGQTYIYEVRENTWVWGNSLSKVFKHEDYDWVTLTRV